MLEDETLKTLYFIQSHLRTVVALGYLAGKKDMSEITEDYRNEKDKPECCSW